MKITNWDELFMRHVYLIASKSKDPRTQVGAVILKDKRVLSEGFNGHPVGVRDDLDRYSNREKKLKLVCHAEFNAVINCARHGISTLNTTIYTSGFPCNECMKSIIQSGITEIVLHKQYPESPKWENSCYYSKMMQKEAGVKVRYFDKLLDVEIMANGELVTV